MKIEIFTSGHSGGAEGSHADSLLDRLERNLPSLETVGITVQLYGLDSDPAVFALHAGIADLLHSEGIGVLPATFIDGKLIAKGRYLAYEELVREAAVRGVPMGANDQQRTIEKGKDRKDEELVRKECLF